MGRFGLYGVAAVLAWGSVPVRAQETAAAPAASCVEVTVDGERAPSYDCMTDKLRPAASARRPDAAQGGMASEAIVQRPGNALGLFNLAATQHRMGNTFGNAVYPQRPPTTAPAVPTIPGR